MWFGRVQHSGSARSNDPSVARTPTGRGTGIPKIIHAMRANGSPRPVFRTDDDHSYFATILPIHPEAQVAAVEYRGDTGHVTGHVAGHVTGHVERLIRRLDGALTRQELQGLLGVVSRAHLRAEYLDPALASGLIERTQPDSPRSRSQRYRLTRAGMALRDRLGER